MPWVSIDSHMKEFCFGGKEPLIVSPKLNPWIKSWAGDNTTFLTTKYWYLRVQDICWCSYDIKVCWYPKIKSGTYVWASPPAAADICLEDLRKALMKRKKSTHIIIIHRLMNPKWIEHIDKATNCIFESLLLNFFGFLIIMNLCSSWYFSLI